ncbi:phage tail protein [Enterobacter roggenkampii]|uniref:phage tail protein n=1 Tax=Enterobacter roggenkampii TaxID=1812935 RepID=UPI003D70049B
MATKYLALLTNIGAAKLAKATALGTKVEITQLAVGDGNGVLPTPNPAQTALVHELRRAPLNMLTVDPANASQIIAEQVIPEDVGGWWIREIGLFDKDGDMVAIANCAETYKPQLQEGSGRVQVIRVILIVSSTEAVTLKIDPAVVLATRQYVDSQLRAHEQSRNHPDASTTEKGFVQLSSSVTSDSESQAATSKAVKIAMDNGSARLAKDRNLSDLPNTALARQNLELGDSSTRNVGTTAGTVASGDDARITGAMQKSQNGGDIPDVAKFLQNLGLGDASGYVGRLLKIQVFTASGTVTKTPGAKKWRIKCLGAGAGSSAAPATGSNEVSVSNGGGAGAYAEGIYDVSSITTASVVIGSGGAGGMAGSIYGADGGTSSVGSFISSPGGKAGLPAGPANPPFQPVANTNSDGPTGWNIVGSSGAGAEPAVAVANSYAAGSRGSNSIFGVGGSIPAINSPANPGGGYGSGASGCSNGQSQSAKSGAAGRPGIVIIEELA